MYPLVTNKSFLRIGLALPWSTSLKCNVWFSILETGSVHLSVTVIIQMICTSVCALHCSIFGLFHTPLFCSVGFVLQNLLLSLVLACTCSYRYTNFQCVCLCGTFVNTCTVCILYSEKKMQWECVPHLMIALPCLRTHVSYIQCHILPHPSFGTLLRRLLCLRLGSGSKYVRVCMQTPYTVQSLVFNHANCILTIF